GASRGTLRTQKGKMSSLSSEMTTTLDMLEMTELIDQKIFIYFWGRTLNTGRRYR
ncbi:hypothetical protein CISIN_1g0404311mg, partial [Citrus sinensis]